MFFVMQIDPEIAFCTRANEPPTLEVRVNFGLLAGREATPAEIDELARLLRPDVGHVSIVAEQRHEIGREAEASVHQVRIEVEDDQLPPGAEELEDFCDQLVETASFWARMCAAERHAEVTE